MASPPAHLPIEAFDPETRGIRHFRIMKDDLDAVLKTHPRHKFFELRGDATPTKAGSCVQEVLAKPSSIFDGVRDLHRGGMCYSGHPPFRWTNGGAQCPPPPGMIFCVYICPLGSVYEWRWEFCDESDADLPQNHKTRYRIQLWPTI